MRVEQSRTERYRDHDGNGPEPVGTESSTARRAAARLDSWIESAPAHSSFSFMSMPASRSTCDFSKTHDFDNCGTERITGATLFIQGKGDVDAIDANDIGQGRLGDCHLLGPAVAMLQSPEGRARIRDMIKEVNLDGKISYEVTFRVPVKRTLIERVTGAPPYKDAKVEVGQDFIKGHAATGDVEGDKTEVWPLVIEAAYAKLYGGHNNIDGGNGTAGLANLTGKKAEEKTLANGLFSYSAQDLVRDFAANKPICITFTRQGGNGVRGEAPAVAKFDAFGMHCYALKDVYEKDGQLYVQLANPWGSRDPRPIPLRELEALKPQVSIGQLP